MSLRALLIDDDARLATLLADYLGAHDVHVVHAPDGGRGLVALDAGGFDVVLLDIMMPGLDGLEVCRRIRDKSQVPILMLTARGDETDRVVGLELGADDYLPKPFSPRELLARIRAVLRRAPADAETPVFESGGLRIDFAAREVRVEGLRQSLTAHEYDLLSALARNAGRVLSRDQLLELVKGEDADEAFDRSIDVHVSRLRQKIEPDPRHPRYVKTVRGAGYLLARES